MREHDRQDVLGEVDAAQQLDAGLRMRPHQRPLLTRQAARLVQDLRRDVDLADVVQQRADAEPEEAAVIPAKASRDGAAEIRDPHAVTLGVRVLRLDGLAPLPDHVEERALHTHRAAVDVTQVMLGTQVREQPVGAVQVLHGLAEPSLARQQVRSLARDFGFEEDVLSSRARASARSKCFSAMVCCPVSRATTPRCFSSSASTFSSPIFRARRSDARHTERARRSHHCAIASSATLTSINTRVTTSPAALAASTASRERALRVVPLAEIRVDHADVVQDATQLRHVSESAVRLDARAIVHECERELAAYGGDDPAVLRDHRDESLVVTVLGATVAPPGRVALRRRGCRAATPGRRARSGPRQAQPRPSLAVATNSAASRQSGAASDCPSIWNVRAAPRRPAQQLAGVRLLKDAQQDLLVQLARGRAVPFPLCPAAWSSSSCRIAGARGRLWLLDSAGYVCGHAGGWGDHSRRLRAAGFLTGGNGGAIGLRLRRHGQGLLRMSLSSGYQATTYPEKCSIENLNCFVSGMVTPLMTSDSRAVLVGVVEVRVVGEIAGDRAAVAAAASNPWG